MIEIVFSHGFLKSAQTIPPSAQQKLSRLLKQLEQDPFYPALHTKRLSGNLAGFLSFRITRDWRVIFQFLEARKVQLLRVRHRKDIYQKFI